MQDSFESFIKTFCCNIFVFCFLFDLVLSIYDKALLYLYTIVFLVLKLYKIWIYLIFLI
jgi:hypothetical protein